MIRINSLAGFFFPPRQKYTNARTCARARADGARMFAQLWARTELAHDLGRLGGVAHVAAHDVAACVRPPLSDSAPLGFADVVLPG